MKTPSNRHLSCVIAATILVVQTSVAAPQNYAEALQKSQFFFDANLSGLQPADSLVEWRGHSDLADGSDLSRDLTGGWYDAGDFWKSNLTMSYAAYMMAWSAVESPNAYTGTRKTILLRQLRSMATYLQNCVIDGNPTQPTNFSNYNVVIDIGGNHPGSPQPNTHAYWGSPETGAALGIKRPSYYVNSTIPGSDVPAAMSATMAMIAHVLTTNSDIATANSLLTTAEKLYNFSATYPTPRQIRDSGGNMVPNPAAIRAIRATDTTTVNTSYRGATYSSLITAAATIARAQQILGKSTVQIWIDKGNVLRNSTAMADESVIAWYRDLGWSNWYQLGAFQMAKLTGLDIYHKDIQIMLSSYSFTGGEGDWLVSPGGLSYRNNQRSAFLLQVNSGITVLALHYSDLVTSAPSVGGYYNNNRTAAQLRDAYRARARRNIDYVLGDNPKNKSYMIGFTNAANGTAKAWPTIVHHRTAFGKWAGNLHKEPGRPEYNPEPRHLLYGGVLAGPDYQDKYEELPGYGIDSHYQTEVAVAINGPWQNALAWQVHNGNSSGGPLTNFPTPESRNDNTDPLTTDRELFVEAQQIGGATNPIRIKARLNNRTRWPSLPANQLSFRYYFTLEPGVSLSQIQLTTNYADGATLSLQSAGGSLAYVKADFGTNILMPARMDWSSPYTRFDRREVEFTLAPTGGATWNITNDFSAQGLGTSLVVLPRIPVYQSNSIVEGDSPVSDPDDSLVGRWDANQTSGTVLNLTGGMASDGTLAGSPLPNWITGGAGDSGALNFTGTNHVVIPGTPALSIPGDITIALAIKPTAWPETWRGRSILQKSRWGWNADWVLAKDTTNGLKGTLKGVGSVTTVGLPPTGQWTHVALVYDRAIPALLMYYDGVEKARTTLGSAPNITNVGEEIRLGTGENDGSWVGGLDNFRVYSRALSAAELEAISGVGGSGVGDGLLGTYFDNLDFTNQVLTRVDSAINFEWGYGSPSAAIAPDTFSARWTGQVQPQHTETYTFHTSTDDGVRLWVNGVQIINKWVNQAPTEWSGSISLVAGQKYDIRMEYYENGGGAAAKLSWSSPNQPKQVIPQSRLFSQQIAAGDGLLGTYFDGPNFTVQKLSRVDPVIDFDWGMGSPDASIGVDTYTVRWTGRVEPLYTETYTFYTSTDDGVRLWVNGVQIIDKWVVQAPTEWSGSISLVAGQKYDIRMEYYENAVGASAKLLWSSPSQPKQIIPQARLNSQ